MESTCPPEYPGELEAKALRSRWEPRYRIVTDRFNGFEVQVWRWWFPFWVMPSCNTSPSVEKAEEWAEKWKQSKHVVKYL